MTPLLWKKNAFSTISAFCRVLLSIYALSLLVGCSSSPVEVLDEVVAQGLKGDEAMESAEYRKLMTLLREKGYQGIGLKYESDRTLKVLYEVFQDKAASGRKIKQVYTGLHLTYDASPKYQALTIGGKIEAGRILAFIRSRVPRR